MHTITRISEERRKEALDLSMYAFQYKVKEEDIPEKLKHYSCQEIYGIFKEDELAAKMHLLNHEVLLQGKTYKMGGVASVATYPEHRRSGMVDALLKEALIIMKKKGQTLSYLHPFKISFYRKYGWEVFSSLKKVTLKGSDLRPLPSAPGRIVRYKKETHPAEANEVYEKFALKYGGMLIRTPYWWDYSVYSDYTLAMYYDTNGHAGGYAIYKVSDKLIDVQEYVSLHFEAARAIWNFICQHDSMVEKAEIITSIHDPFPYYLSQPKVETSFNPYFMARIVDAEKFLSQYTFNTLEKNLVITITDQAAEWNNRTYVISNEEVTALNEEERGHEAEAEGISLSINALTAVLLGAQKADVLAEVGQIAGTPEAISAFHMAVPDIKPFFYDFF
ncbi:GNAT family N-acetyltransferase [Peribacillus deserti]|uniref:GNAT family N-acetyltransferase n=1 Tax=Peribacillus deserti TaxID=673318 RepID=A0A2N5LZP0_9BACI|nr:GNAT family N-acetyltransferase [Peribacillus deserti]PLT27586.1 GNAT family N-acetyltransferase [Peribacillus deserti]